MRRFETSIRFLMQAKTEYQFKYGESPIFLSDWDSDYNSVKMPALSFSSSELSKIQKYYFWTDEEKYKEYVKAFLHMQHNYVINDNNFTISSNGSASLMIALTALHESGKNNALVVTPVYFSVLNLLDELNYNVAQYNLSMVDNFAINIKRLEDMIMQKHIDTLILTNPPFGTGVEIEVKTIYAVANICNKWDVCLVMDYIYGGLPWYTKEKCDYILSVPVLRAVSSSEQYIFIESISKRLFLNGAKFALVFSSQKIMKRLLRLSVFMVGSMSEQQVNLIPQIYSFPNWVAIAELISDNAAMASARFGLLQSAVKGTQIKLSEANCGYFVLASMPITTAQTETDYALSILNKFGVLTTPHSRYLFCEPHYYSFRINLLLSKENLIEGISRLKNV